MLPEEVDAVTGAAAAVATDAAADVTADTAAPSPCSLLLQSQLVSIASSLMSAAFMPSVLYWVLGESWRLHHMHGPVCNDTSTYQLKSQPTHVCQ